MIKNRKKRILIVPLNWGLGHATRIVPIIKKLQKTDAEILVGGSPTQIELLKQEFPSLQYLAVPYLNITLSSKPKQVFRIAFQLPKFLFHIIREHFYLKKLIRQHQIDAVISDNCYGLWNKRIPTVFITHQLSIQLPKTIRIAERLINKLHRALIKPFDICWVPDLPHNGIAGTLSHTNNSNLNVQYIGILSRFVNSVEKKSTKDNSGKNLLILLSGPEPQRTQFENIIAKEIELLPQNIGVTVVRGLPKRIEISKPNWFNHLPASELKPLIVQADCIIARSGYSTIMDLIALGKTACLVPTPGQSEQEYLATHLEKSFGFITMIQGEFSINEILRKDYSYNTTHTKIVKQSDTLLKEQVDQLLRRINKSSR